MTYLPSSPFRPRFRAVVRLCCAHINIATTTTHCRQLFLFARENLLVCVGGRWVPCHKPNHTQKHTMTDSNNTSMNKYLNKKKQNSSPRRYSPNNPWTTSTTPSHSKNNKAPMPARWTNLNVALPLPTSSSVDHAQQPLAAGQQQQQRQQAVQTTTQLVPLKRGTRKQRQAERLGAPTPQQANGTPPSDQAQHVASKAAPWSVVAAAPAVTVAAVSTTTVTHSHGQAGSTVGLDSLPEEALSVIFAFLDTRDKGR
eukprot:m.55962 g.55962  ORF g.55962 m.55962 type:complete len:255 (-) comp12567_c0_seq2:64-828(-)